MVHVPCLLSFKNNYPRIISEMGDHISKHGDGVKEIAFSVEDLDAIFAVSCTLNGANPNLLD